MVERAPAHVVAGRILREERTTQGLTLDGLATAGGIRGEQLGRLERGEQNSTLGTVSGAIQGAHLTWTEFGRRMDRGMRGEPTSATAKEKLERLVDELSAEEAAKALAAVEREVTDPLVRAIASAPGEHEPYTPEQEAAIGEGSADIAARRTVSLEEIKRELGSE
jgi:transcriptional regulator with XRE-family HTH domain